jgi:hypothetical protein
MYRPPKQADRELVLWLIMCTLVAALARPQSAWAVGGSGFLFGVLQGGGQAIRTATPIDTTYLGSLGLTQTDVGGGLASLVLAEDGRVFSFGENSSGQLGLTGVTDQFVAVPTPIDISNLGGRKITQVSAGPGYNLLLAEDGSVFSFGAGTSIATPIDTSNLGGLKIKQVSAGGLRLLLADNGSVFSFGAGTSIATPIDASNLGGRKITQVAAGSQHNLLLADDGSVFSFGINANGRTGLDTSVGETLIPTPIDATNLGGLKVLQVAAGTRHSMLLAEDGRVFTFGENGSGKTGLGTTTGDTLLPTPIDTTNLGGLGITQLAAGSDHSLVLAEDGRVFSFGSGSLGRTGYGTTTSSSIAMPIDRANLVGFRVTSISAGTYTSLLIAEPRLPGDYNDNGIVDAADYVVWRKTLGQLVPPGMGADGNGNGEITQLDYSFWGQHFGNTNAAGAAALASERTAVPEPCGLFLAVFGACLTLSRARRR